ncbi:MAG TPA: 2-phosphosulfolactate phosphatase [Tepidisphaeraceae bacterium]|nr:2-phosphosulfolactate phosphatase [Tepidisphaeraceae bacterium]
MVTIDVALLPRDLPANQSEQAVVVLDVLRATTSMAAALAAGVKEIRVFGDVTSAQQAARAYSGKALLCGELQCLPPPGFDLGNSPDAFGPIHAGRTVFMSTTNGTRAIIAARSAKRVLTGAIVNAEAVAERLIDLGMNATLLCAGTNGRIAMEDLIGAGAILHSLQKRQAIELGSDVARVALRLFDTTRDGLRAALGDAQGGRNVIAAGLPEDIDFAAKLNSLSAVGVIKEEPLRVVPWGDEKI